MFDSTASAGRDDSIRAEAYARTTANTPRRGRDRANWDRETIHEILDATPVCHLSYVVDDSDDLGPITIPTTFARRDDQLVFHSSSGAHVARLAITAGGAVPVCLSVTLVDGYVLARSGFHHSMNYRAVVVRGRARVITDEQERLAALDTILDAVWPGRSGQVRPPHDRELAATTVFRLPLEVVSAKVRAGDAVDEPEDLDLPHWAGVVPVTTVLGDPVPNADLPDGVHLPGQ